MSDEPLRRDLLFQNQLVIPAKKVCTERSRRGSSTTRAWRPAREDDWAARALGRSLVLLFSLLVFLSFPPPFSVFFGARIACSVLPSCRGRNSTMLQLHVLDQPFQISAEPGARHLARGKRSLPLPCRLHPENAAHDSSSSRNQWSSTLMRNLTSFTVIVFWCFLASRSFFSCW